MILVFYMRNFRCSELCCVIIPVVVRCLLVAYIHFFRCQIFVNWINGHLHTASTYLRWNKTGGLSRSPNAVNCCIKLLSVFFFFYWN